MERVEHLRTFTKCSKECLGQRPGPPSAVPAVQAVPATAPFLTHRLVRAVPAPSLEGARPSPGTETFSFTSSLRLQPLAPLHAPASVVLPWEQLLALPSACSLCVHRDRALAGRAPPSFCPAVLLSCCASVLLCFCPAALLPFCPSVLLSCYPSALLSCCPSVLLPFCPSVLLPFYPSVLLPFCPAVLLSFCPAALLSFCPSALLSCCPSVLLPCCPAVLLSFCPAALLPFCPSVLLSCCPSALLPFCPSVLLSCCPSALLSAPQSRARCLGSPALLLHPKPSHPQSPGGTDPAPAEHRVAAWLLPAFPWPSLCQERCSLRSQMRAGVTHRQPVTE